MATDLRPGGSSARAGLVVSAGYEMRQVRFPAVDGSQLAGCLYVPQGLDRPCPGVPILGPQTFVKEQSPTQYAKRLANDGFVALAFDPRYAGQSGGEPRRREHPLHKADDARAALDYLASRPEVDAEQLVAMAICQGSSAMLRAAADDPRVKALATAAGHYRDHDGDVLWMGGEEHLARRRHDGELAARKFEQTGEVDYVPAIDPERTDVGMPGRFVFDWYSPWADAGIWENRYAVMSDADLFAFESLTAAQRLTTPWLMIHSDNSFLPPAARRHFDAVPAGTATQLQWDGDIGHFQYYDDPVVLDRTVASIVGWFRQHLRLPPPASAHITY